MAKRFLKQPTPTESEDVGCLSGFISIFDFRVGHYSQKLLSDRKCEVSRGLEIGYSRKKLNFPSNLEIKLEDIDVSLHKDGDESRSKRDNSGIMSVKTLMEEEMSKIHNMKIQNNQLELSQSESELGIHTKEKKKKKSKKCNVAADQHLNDLRCSSNLDFGQSNSTNPTERSPETYDLAAFMVQFYSCPLSESIVHREKIHIDETDSQFSEKYFTILKALNEVAKVFLNQKLVDLKELISNVEVQSREFIDALEILSSNKELLVKLIQDPNLPLLKHIQDIQDALGECKVSGEETSTSDQPEDNIRNELFQKQSCHKLFRKKDKPKGSDSTQDISKIVVLKPSPTGIQNSSVTQTLTSSALSEHSLKHREEDERTKSYFSFKGIKRRLKQVIGENRKGQHPISMDGVLDRIPYGFKGSETRKHLSEMVAAVDEKDSLPTVSKSVDYLSGYNLLSPRFSPGNDKELLLSPRKIMLSPSQQLNRERPMDSLSPLRQNLDQDAGIQVTDSNQECAAEELKRKGRVEIVEALDIKSLEEHDDLNVRPESIGNEPGVICEGCEEKGSCALLELEMPNDKRQLMIPSLSISPSFLHIEKLENPGDTLEKPERPSPVSVLEPFFLEDITSTGSTTSDHVDLHIQPQQIDFEEHDGSTVVLSSSDFEGRHMTFFDEEAIYGFITPLLQASGMRCYGILEECDLSDQLLDPSLLEAGILHNLPDDPKLLCDCINEVLVETQKRRFECTPWVSLIKPGSQEIMRGFDLVEEVCKGIHRHLQLSQFTLDHIITKDINRSSWMDHQVEIKAIIIDTADGILEEIIEEIISR